MKYISIFALVASVALLVSGAAKAASNTGDPCDDLGASEMDVGHSAINVCLLNTYDVSATDCSTGCRWSRMVASSLGAETVHGITSYMPIWTAPARSVDCPPGSVVTGILVNTAGTCDHKCGPDGPIIRSIQVKCSALE